MLVGDWSKLERRDETPVSRCRKDGCDWDKEPKCPRDDDETGLRGVLGVEMDCPWHFKHRPCSSAGEVPVQLP